MTDKLTVPEVTSASQLVAPMVSAWVDNTTAPDSPRRLDLIRDKSNAVLDFFNHADKAPVDVDPMDVKEWQADLESQDLAASTVYSKISKVSSFYRWCIETGLTTKNPVSRARPKAPQAYQTKSTQPLLDEEVKALMNIVKDKAQTSIVGKRDYALLLFFFFTGKRRSEIINLRRQDIKINGTLVITSRLKGGDFSAYEIAHGEAKNALLAYIAASGRQWDDMQPDDPIWLAHDRSGQNTGKKLSSHGFVKNLKAYAKAAGIDHIHLHMTRHTAAGWTDDISEAQTLLDHKHQSTTRIYKKRVSVKRDTFSNKAANKLGI